MSWLLITILAYFILAVVFLVDKYLLTSSIPNPKVYAFYAGLLGCLVIFLIPFVGFFAPSIFQIALALASGAAFVAALFWFYKGLKTFEASRIIPAVGGLIPLFTFGLVYIFSRGQETLSLTEMIAGVFLITGSFLINFEREKSITKESLKFSALAALLFSIYFVLAKYVYLEQPFWNGFIWTKLGSLLAAVLLFFLYKEIREEVFKGKTTGFSKKTFVIFAANQSAGGAANILQNWALSLAPLASVAIINALQGIQYVFLLVLVVFISFKFPRILKEEISQKIISQKIIAILLIAAGLASLAL